MTNILSGWCDVLDKRGKTDIPALVLLASLLVVDWVNSTLANAHVEYNGDKTDKELRSDQMNAKDLDKRKKLTIDRITSKYKVHDLEKETQVDFNDFVGKYSERGSYDDVSEIYNDLIAEIEKLHNLLNALILQVSLANTRHDISVIFYQDIVGEVHDSYEKTNKLQNNLEDVKKTFFRSIWIKWS